MVGAGLGVISMPPAWSRKVMVMVPETVPVWIDRGALADVLPVGISKVAVVPPVENCMVRSAGPVSGEKLRIA
jgi:hypothetical protein